MVSAYLADLQTDEKVKAVDAAVAQHCLEGTVTEKQSATVHAPTTIANDDDAPGHDRSNQN
jgi:hypothetical protein